MYVYTVFIHCDCTIVHICLFYFYICRHPLFSLLALMLEKCEQATQGYVSANQTSSTSPNGTPNGNCEGDSFSRDIQAFVHLLEKEKRPLLTNNAELDGLVSDLICSAIEEIIYNCLAASLYI